MSRTAITLKFKMLWLPNEERYGAVKLWTDINIPSLIPHENKNFGGSLVLDFRKRWRHVKTIYRTKLALNLHSWKMIYLNIIGLFLSSFLCTTFIFLSLRCVRRAAKKISDFFFLDWYYMCFSPLFSGVFWNIISYGKRMEILLYSVSFCPLKSNLRI